MSFQRFSLQISPPKSKFKVYSSCNHSSFLYNLFRRIHIMQNDKRLKLYIVSCHVDKPLKEGAPKSIYDCHIQAGAALTDQRTCPINDYDDCPDNISERNRRYGEGTAMYWINKHLNTHYVGIMHYRRRLNLKDEDYSHFMDSDIDIITSVPIRMICSGNTNRHMSIEEHYRTALYSYDWDLLMRLIKQSNVDSYYYAKECFSQTALHACNINVMRSELYHEYCEWAFPICEEFYNERPEKFDIFQKRDIGYILERMTHLFIMNKKKEGLKIIEAPIIELDSKKWSAHNESDLNDATHVFNVCNELYDQNQISRISELLNVALNEYAITDDRLCVLARMIVASHNERCEVPQTMFEYLPAQFRSNLVILTDIWSGFEQAVKLYYENQTNETLEKLDKYMSLTGFSKSALRTALAIAEGKKII